MSYQGPQVFKDAVAELSRLPGVGEKTARRLVFYLVRQDAEKVRAFTDAVSALKETLRLCSDCFSYTDEVLCLICKDSSRDRALMCLVEDPSDVFAVEASAQFRGVYHVLHGRLSPLDGIGPSQLKTSALLDRIQAHPPKEVILAMNPDVEGEATAVYYAKLLAERGIPVSRLAMGIPMGGHLEYTDHITLGRALVERRRFTTSLP